MTRSVRARVEALERDVRKLERRPVLLLKTYDGETYGGPDGQTYTDADFARLNQDHDVVVIEYVKDWRPEEVTGHDGVVGR